MILYINGNEHCAGAGAVVKAVHAEDDINLWWMGQTAHPSNLNVSFGNYLRQILKARLINQAHAGSTNETIILETKKFLETNPVQEQIVAIFGMPESNLEQLQDFGAYLRSKNIKHIIYPHEDYVEWLTKKKFVPDEQGYFGRDAHAAWAGHLVRPLTTIL